MKNFKILKYTAAALVISTLFINCNNESIDKDNPSIPYPAIGGYENSDAIAAGNLVSKFSFENNITDKMGNIKDNAPMNVGYVAGAKGNAYQGSSDQMRYFVGDANASITGLNSYTIAFWMNSAGTVDPATPGQGKGAQGIFSIVRPTEFWGGINLFLENPDGAFPNRIRLKIDVENGRPGVVWGGQGAIMNLDNSKNKWIHVVFSYNSKTSTLSAYKDGEPAANLGSFPYAPAGGVQGFAKLFADNPGGIDNPNNAPGYGDFVMKGTNGKVVFGNHAFETRPPLNNGSAQDWATSYAGMLDEFRIYNVALSNADIAALYKLEKDGR